MKAAKDAGEEHCDPTRGKQHPEEKRDKISTLERAPLRSESHAVCGEFGLEGLGPECFVEGVFCNGRRWLPTKFVGQS